MTSFIDKIKSDLEPHVLALPLGKRILARTGIAAGEGTLKLMGYAIVAGPKLTIWIMKFAGTVALSAVATPPKKKKKK